LCVGRSIIILMLLSSIRSLNASRDVENDKVSLDYYLRFLPTKNYRCICHVRINDFIMLGWNKYEYTADMYLFELCESTYYAGILTVAVLMKFV
jgi:hypothetical protein